MDHVGALQQPRQLAADCVVDLLWALRPAVTYTVGWKPPVEAVEAEGGHRFVRVSGQDLRPYGVAGDHRR
nr:hypothetical protein [Streptomyces sp. WZ.A104]